MLIGMARTTRTVVTPINILTGKRKLILHVDADAFFASCEQAVHPRLQGKPVITGAERGIVAAASYEAKAYGVTRGMRLFEVRERCPKAVIMPSDYETYGLFSRHMFDVLRLFCPVVEEYSIDEAFGEITGQHRTTGCTYVALARRIQATILRHLNISVSIGVSYTKVLAKIASKHRKPHGVTAIGAADIPVFLSRLPVGEVWGIGHNTAAFLNKHGVFTAWDFAQQPESWVIRHLSKPYVELWHELNGRQVYRVSADEREPYQSMCKFKTFTPPACDREFVYGQLVRNLENACIKARKHNLDARSIVVYLRTQEFEDSAVELRLPRPTAFPNEIMPALRAGYAALYKPQTLYRSTGAVLTRLQSQEALQPSLFENAVQLTRLRCLQGAVDRMAGRFGKHSVFIASSLPSRLQAQHDGERGAIPWRRLNLLPGESERRKVGMILVDLEV